VGCNRRYTPEEYKEHRRAYMRKYQREYKRKLLEIDPVKFRHDPEKETRVDRSGAAYDPMRDGHLPHRDLTAVLLGDPPIGRSALDRQA
jgi:hypothetical protein